MAGARHHVPAGWYELAVRSHAVMLTCGFTCTYSGIVLFHPDVLRGSGAEGFGNDAPSDDDGLVIQMHAIFRPQQLAISRTPLPAEAGYHRPGSS